MSMLFFKQLNLHELDLSAKFSQFFLVISCQIFEFIGSFGFQLHLPILWVFLTITKSVFNVSLLQYCLHFLVFHLEGLPFSFIQQG